MWVNMGQKATCTVVDSGKQVFMSKRIGRLSHLGISS